MKRLLSALFITLSFTAFTQTKLSVTEQRIESRIIELAKFGKDVNGRGYRVAFTKGDIEARTWYMALMKNAGLEVSIDYAGNIIGKRKGKNPSLKPIACIATLQCAHRRTEVAGRPRELGRRDGREGERCRPTDRCRTAVGGHAEAKPDVSTATISRAARRFTEEAAPFVVPVRPGRIDADHRHSGKPFATRIAHGLDDLGQQYDACFSPRLPDLVPYC